MTDLTVSLAQDGHEVSAICADSGYALPAGTATPPVAIHRVKSFPFSRGVLGRVLSYLSFYIVATVRALTLPRHDVVLTLTTPPLLSVVGMLVRLLRGSRHFIWEMDVYPDVAIDLDYFKAGGITDRIVGALADLSRREADGIIALGPCMKDRLVRRGIAADHIFIADNWADANAIQPLDRPGDPNRLVLLYSGNLGLAHDVDTVASAMLQLRDDARFQFLFVGGGGRTHELAAFCKENAVSSVEFRPYAKRSSLSESLSTGDIGLVTQRDACCGSVVPSKVYGLLAAGRPILFVGPREATPARIIERFGCGWHIACGDTAALVALLQRLSEDRDLVRDAGQRARQALLDHYDRPIGIARIARILGLTPSGQRSGAVTAKEHRTPPVAFLTPPRTTENRS